MSILHNSYRVFRRVIFHRIIQRSSCKFDLNGPVEIVGRLSEPSGIGESARLCLSALTLAGIEATPLDVDKKREREISRQRDDVRLRIFHLNPPMMPRGILAVGPFAFQKSFNIGYWAWELEALPGEWVHALGYMNAIFVPSSFTNAAISRHARIPVFTVPHPIRETVAEAGVRDLLGIPSRAFLVSSVLNLSSSAERKNPLGTIAAFQAHRAQNPTSVLVLKLSGSAESAEMQRVISAANRVDGIRVVPDYWPSDRIAGLIAESDAYISLHRSEGFGLTVAEAILRKIPVVTTGWSGNLDFCDPESTFLVECNQIPVVDVHPELMDARGATWAQPDIEQAAKFLTQICLAPDQAHTKAARAKSHLIDWVSKNTYKSALGRLEAHYGFQRELR